jgi:hypothetical protein
VLQIVTAAHSQFKADILPTPLKTLFEAFQADLKLNSCRQLGRAMLKMPVWCLKSDPIG